MSKLIFWDWEKKKRTPLRFIKAGDVFCFQYHKSMYCFGRIISRLDIGCIAEVFDYVSNEPKISEECIDRSKRIIDPVNLDIYTLFDKKMMGDWRIIGHHESFTATNVDNMYFVYGVPNSWTKIDVYGNATPISNMEAENLPKFYVMNDYDIKELLASKLNENYLHSWPVEYDLPMNENSVNEALKNKLAPFFWVEHENSFSFCLYVGGFKDEIFEARADEGFEGGGYDWGSLAQVFLDEKMPDLKMHVHFDPEASLFCAYSDNAEALQKFAFGFRAMCDDDNMMSDLFSRAELD